MDLKEIIKDAFRYSASDFKIIALLGIILLLADLADELSGAGELANELKLVLFVIVILIAIFEAGYVFRIVEETIQGSEKLPKFNNFRLMFSHGLNEILILIIYLSLPLFLLSLYFFNFLVSMDLNDVPEQSAIIFLGFVFLAAIIYAFFPAVILHRAHNNGKFKSGFEFRKIYHKIRTVGVKRLVVVYLGIFIIVTIVEVVLADTISGIIPLIGDLITDLLIAPFLLVFTARVLGLIDVP